MHQVAWQLVHNSQLNTRTKILLLGCPIVQLSKPWFQVARFASQVHMPSQRLNRNLTSKILDEHERYRFFWIFHAILMNLAFSRVCIIWRYVHSPHVLAENRKKKASHHTHSGCSLPCVLFYSNAYHPWSWISTVENAFANKWIRTHVFHKKWVC